jgi:hypothetical protein
MVHLDPHNQKFSIKMIQKKILREIKIRNQEKEEWNNKTQKKNPKKPGASTIKMYEKLKITDSFVIFSFNFFI